MLSFSITIITLFFIYKMFDFYLQNLEGLCLCRLCCGSKSGWQLISWMAMVVVAVAVLQFGRVRWVNSSGQHLKCIFMIWWWRFEEGVNGMRDICGVGVCVWIVEIVVLNSNLTHSYSLPCLLMTVEPPGSWGRHPFFPRYSDLNHSPSL